VLLTGTFLVALASAVCTGWASHTENHILDSAKKASYIPWGAEETGQDRGHPVIHIVEVEPNLNDSPYIWVY